MTTRRARPSSTCGRPGCSTRSTALTPDQRDVLYLRILADLSVPEIARVLDKPETAVKALLRRGLARLQRAVAGAEADTED